jgi:hypothetical protein
MSQSRQKNQACAVLGGIPERFHISQRNWFYVGLRGMISQRTEEVRKRLKHLVHGCTPEPTSKKLDAGASAKHV